MKVSAVVCLLVFSLLSPLLAEEPRIEKIVCLRHGEKPANDLGQLSVEGLNRALALPKALERYGRPKSIFAPLTNRKGNYSYVRPLATIEPTAILLGLPVQTTFDFDQIDQLEAELLKPEYESAVVIVAWEHHLLEKFVQNLERDLQGTDKIPAWEAKDFDSIYLVTIRTENGVRTVTFTREEEGITPSSNFPSPAK